MHFKRTANTKYTDKRRTQEMNEKLHTFCQFSSGWWRRWCREQCRLIPQLDRQCPGRGFSPPARKWWSGPCTSCPQMKSLDRLQVTKWSMASSKPKCWGWVTLLVCMCISNRRQSKHHQYITIVNTEPVVALREAGTELSCSVVDTSVQLAEVGQGGSSHPDNEVLIFIPVVVGIFFIQLIDVLVPVHRVGGTLKG